MPNSSSSFATQREARLLITVVMAVVYSVFIAFFATVAVREHKPWFWLFVLSFLILIGLRIHQARKHAEAHPL